MKTLEEIKNIKDSVIDTMTQAKNEAHNLVREIVKEKKEIFLDGGGAYAMEDCVDTWEEIHLVAIRYKNDTIQFATTVDIDDDGNDIPYWDNGFDEYDHYHNINWLSVLDAIAFALEAEQQNGNI